MIDDAQGSPKKAGVFWDDRDIIQQIDSSQYSCVNWAADNRLSHLLEGLVTSEDYTLGSDKHTDTLPTDYLYAISGQIDGLPARLHFGGVGTIFEEINHYGVAVGSDNKELVFIGGHSGGTGTLWYYKAPQSFFNNTTTNRTELFEPLYHAIMYHAAAVLLLKDGVSTRLKSNFDHAMKRLVQDEPVPIPTFDDF